MERLYRPHRGSLAEAMKEVRKIDNVEHLVRKRRTNFCIYI